MKIKNILYTLPLLSVLMTSCEDVSLEPTVENTFTDEYTWKFGNYAQGVLMNAYADVPLRFNHYGNNFLDVATDNAVTNNYSSGLYNYAAGGSISPFSNPIGDWNGPYNNFRYIHLFMENGLKEDVVYNVTDAAANIQERERLKGEAFFLRAWWGFQLLQDFGGKTATGIALGYPIITQTRTEEELKDPNDARNARNTYEECVKQIVADIDSAVKYLPVKYQGSNSVTGDVGLGRADDQVALALKSMVSLYAASPAYQNDDVTQLTGMGQFTVVNSAAYQAKWERAAQVAQEALEVVSGNVPGLKAADFTANSTAPEFIWRKYHRDRNLETYNFPPLDFGNGYTSPSENLVDAFPGKNGYPINDTRSEFDPEDPYANRDPRLALTVMYNGQVFHGDPLETFVGGKDTKAVHYQATRTGYYLRKWLGLNASLEPESPSNEHHYHVLLRKTELLLNLAEAANEAFGPTGTGPGVTMTAAEAINKIRSNAGITSVDYVTEVAGQGKDAFRKLIQNERRIELAFENHRFFDMRRWLLPLNESVKGVQITKNADGSLKYDDVLVEQRRLDNVKYYYQPIPFNEQIKSGIVRNNLGW